VAPAVDDFISPSIPELSFLFSGVRVAAWTSDKSRAEAATGLLDESSTDAK